MRDYTKWHKRWDLSRFLRNPRPDFWVSSFLRRLFGRSYDYDEEKEEYLLKIDVPGIEKEKISVKASKDTLTVDIEDKPYFYPMPQNSIPENIYATLKLGILTIHLPKKEQDQFSVNID